MFHCAGVCNPIILRVIFDLRLLIQNITDLRQNGVRKCNREKVDGLGFSSDLMRKYFFVPNNSSRHPWLEALHSFRKMKVNSSATKALYSVHLVRNTYETLKEADPWWWDTVDRMWQVCSKTVRAVIKTFWISSGRWLHAIC